MPNWKKLIVSGSNAVLNTTTASVFLSTTGSSNIGFIGTSSWARSASWAPFPSLLTPLNSIQFNSGSSLSGSTNFTFINSSNTVYLTGSLLVTGSVTASKVLISSSGDNQLKIIGSGSTNPITGIYGSQGNLLTINDSLSGSILSVNDISGFTIFDVQSDKNVYIGDFNAFGLHTSKLFNITTTGAFKIYAVPSSTFTGMFIEYTAASGSNARAGNITAIRSGSTVNYNETTTTDIGNTTALSFIVAVSSSLLALSGSNSTANWQIKSIIRAI